MDGGRVMRLFRSRRASPATRRRIALLVVTLFLAVLAAPPPARAHAGAPYPVLVEEPAGPYVLSALADPDTGTGTFFVQVATAAGGSTPAGTGVSVAVHPQDHHLPEAIYPAAWEGTRYGDRFVARVPFDARGPWEVRLVVDGPAGRGEVSFPVQVTSPGISWLTGLICLVPFVLLGLLWIRGVRRSRPRQP